LVIKNWWTGSGSTYLETMKYKCRSIKGYFGENASWLHFLKPENFWT
jgi:hypothetical protein